MADSCSEEAPLTRLETEELVYAVINPTASKGRVKRKRSKSLVLNAVIVAAECLAENTRLLFEN